MRWSYSRIDTFERCPFKYRLRYLEKVEADDVVTADNALRVGTMAHDAIRLGCERAIEKYFMSYNIIDDDHETEAMKIEIVTRKVKEQLPIGGAFEVCIQTPDFIGYIDYLVPVGKDTYDIYDFKYTTKCESYRYSAQLHLYKYFFEKCFPRKHIRNLYFLIIPKTGVKRKATETLEVYRDRIRKELTLAPVNLMKVEYDPNKIIKSLLNIKRAQECTKFEPKDNEYCYFCEYRALCDQYKTHTEKGGIDMFVLPKNERRKISDAPKRTMWWYGQPFSGKTTLANSFPDPLMLNTDGNTKFVDAPVVFIKDEVKSEGRITTRTYAWEMFKEVISELEKKDNTFKTIVVDLLEDLYTHCRLYMYNEMGITHESDDSFKAWDKVRTEFLTTLKRLMNLDYENIILISHEDSTKDITKRSGDKVTSIKPNIPDKVALKVAGMVDMVARIVSEDGKRSFTFKSDEVVFGGGRLKVDRTEIPLEVDELFDVYKTATEAAAKKTRTRATKKEELPNKVDFDSEEAKEMAAEVEAELIEDESRDRAEAMAEREQETERPRRRTRRTRTTDEEE